MSAVEEVDALFSARYSGKEKLAALNAFYEQEFRRTIPRKVQSLGIAYSPIEAVDYILHFVQELLQIHWNKTLGSPGIQIIEPFAGTGTFLARLIADKTLISDDELLFKYQREIFGNEILPLAYLAAQANIASAFQERTGKRLPFPNLWLGDTFLAYENQNNPQPTFEIDGFQQNAKILENQKQSKIRVIIGNPPWSMQDKVFGQTEEKYGYDELRKRIEKTYVAESDKHQKGSLYDTYIHAIRWASDRLGDPKSEDNDGVFGFITNGGFIKGGAASGLRKCLIKEFDSIYVYNLRGNARSAGEHRKKEGGSIFPGTQAGVALIICCRKPKTNRRQRDGVLKYVDVGDYLTLLQKKAALRKAVQKGVLKGSGMQRIKPDAKGDWLDQANPEFQSLYPLYGKDENRIFLQTSQGASSCRDAWVYDYDRAELEARVWRMMEFFNQQPKEKKAFYEDGEKFGWTHGAKNMLRSGFKMEHDPEKIVTSFDRPFCKMHLYFCESVIEVMCHQHRYFPIGKENQSICVAHHDVNYPFSCLMVDCVPSRNFNSVQTITLPRWVYSKEGERESNINPLALRAFNSAVGLKPDDDAIDADGLFHYVYGFLHKEDWRKKWAITLRKEAARIDLPKNLAQFQKLSDAGRKLAELHLNYESCEPFADWEIEKAADFDERNPAHFEVEKMRYGGKPGNWDKTMLRYNRFLTIRGIPMECHNYRLGARSALDWLVNRYRVKVDKRSQIRKNPNRWLADESS